MSRSPAESTDKSRRSSRLPIPTQRVEEKYWSHVASRTCASLDAAFPPDALASTRVSKPSDPPTHEKRVPVLASHPDASIPGDHPGRAFRTTTRTPASLKGSLTRRILTFVSLCLADECNRPNCQRIADSGWTASDARFDLDSE